VLHLTQLPPAAAPIGTALSTAAQPQTCAHRALRSKVRNEPLHTTNCNSHPTSQQLLRTPLAVSVLHLGPQPWPWRAYPQTPTHLAAAGALALAATKPAGKGQGPLGRDDSDRHGVRLLIETRDLCFRHPLLHTGYLGVELLCCLLARGLAAVRVLLLPLQCARH